MKKLLIVNGSPRKNGTDAAMTAKAAEIAEKYGYESETVWTYDLGIGGCRGCMACKKTGKCVQKDCMNDVIAKVKDSDMILFATPVYFGGETGPFKTFIDRLYPCVTVDAEGNRAASLGKVAKMSILITCGAPNGNMLYGSIMTKYMNLMKTFGITDVSGTVVPTTDPEKFIESSYAQEFFSNIEFQLEM